MSYGNSPGTTGGSNSTGGSSSPGTTGGSNSSGGPSQGDIDAGFNSPMGLGHPAGRYGQDAYGGNINSGGGPDNYTDNTADSDDDSDDDSKDSSKGKGKDSDSKDKDPNKGKTDFGGAFRDYDSANDFGGFGGLGIGNPGSYGGQKSVGAPGFGGDFGENDHFSDAINAVKNKDYTVAAGSLVQGVIGLAAPNFAAELDDIGYAVRTGTGSVTDEIGEAGVGLLSDGLDYATGGAFAHMQEAYNSAKQGDYKTGVAHALKGLTSFGFSKAVTPAVSKKVSTSLYRNTESIPTAIAGGTIAGGLLESSFDKYSDKALSGQGKGVAPDTGNPEGSGRNDVSGKVYELLTSIKSRNTA